MITKAIGSPYEVMAQNKNRTVYRVTEFKRSYYERLLYERFKLNYYLVAPIGLVEWDE